MRVYINIHKSIYIYIIYINFFHLHSQTYIHAYVHACMSVYMHMAHIYIYVYIFIYIYIYIYGMYMHIYTQDVPEDFLQHSRKHVGKTKSHSSSWNPYCQALGVLESDLPASSGSRTAFPLIVADPTRMQIS